MSKGHCKKRCFNDCQHFLKLYTSFKEEIHCLKNTNLTVPEKYMINETHNVSCFVTSKGYSFSWTPETSEGYKFSWTPVTSEGYKHSVWAVLMVHV